MKPLTLTKAQKDYIFFNNISPHWIKRDDETIRQCHRMMDSVAAACSYQWYDLQDRHEKNYEAIRKRFVADRDILLAKVKQRDDMIRQLLNAIDSLGSVAVTKEMVNVCYMIKEQLK